MRGLMRCVGCLTLAALLLGGPAARAADEKKDRKDGEKKEEKKKRDRPDVPFPDLEKLFEALGGGLNDEQMKEFQQRMEQVREAMKQLQQGGGLPPRGFGFGFPPLGGGMRVPAPRRASVQEARLGAKLREPSAALIDQLDLPKDQGLVLEEVGVNSAAARAGLKANDVLLEVNGKAVSRKKDEFDKALAGVEANKAVDVVVMRKGKKETLKGLKLPEPKAAAAPAPRPGDLLRRLGGLKGGMTAVTRRNDEFTAKHVSGGVTYVVKGKVSDGKAEPTEITITDGESNRYASIDEVPREHQETVKELVQMSGGSR